MKPRKARVGRLLGGGQGKGGKLRSSSILTLTNPKDAVSKQAKTQIAKLEGQMRAAIDEKVETKLSGVRERLGRVNLLVRTYSVASILGRRS